MSDAFNICFYSIANITHLEILGQLLRNTLNCNVGLDQFLVKIIFSNSIELVKNYIWRSRHVDSMGRVSVQTTARRGSRNRELNLCMTSTNE